MIRQCSYAGWMLCIYRLRHRSRVLRGNDTYKIGGCGEIGPRLIIQLSLAGYCHVHDW